LDDKDVQSLDSRAIKAFVRAPKQRKRDELEIPDVNTAMWVPDKDNQALGSWQDLSLAPPQVSSGIDTILRDDYLNKLDHRTRYGRMFRHQEKYIAIGSRMNTMLYSKGSTKNTWSKSKGDITRACDQCITARRLCAKPAIIDGALRLALYPLPDCYRRGKEWTDVGFGSGSEREHFRPGHRVVATQLRQYAAKNTMYLSTYAILTSCLYFTMCERSFTKDVVDPLV
jgi:hypothetical protein